MPAIFQTNILPVGDDMRYISKFWNEATVTAGNSFGVFNLDSQQYHNFYMFHEPPAIGDSSELTIELTPGDYVMNVLGFESSIGGIQEIYFDTDVVPVATFDRYNPIPSANVLFSANVTIVNQSTVVRSFTSGNTFPSTNFYVSTTRIWFTPV